MSKELDKLNERKEHFERLQACENNAIQLAVKLVNALGETYNEAYGSCELTCLESAGYENLRNAALSIEGGIRNAAYYTNETLNDIYDAIDGLEEGGTNE